MSIKLDFSSIFNYQKSLIYVFNNKLNDFTKQDDLWDLYQFLIRSRHDFVHLTVSMVFHNQWVPEKPIKVHFPEYIGFGYDKTPDLLFEYMEKVIIFDISVSMDPKKSKQDKLDKYIDLKHGLSSFLKKEVVIYIFNLESNLRNLENLYSEFTDYFKKDIDLSLFTQFFKIYEDLYNRLFEKFDKEYLNNKKIEEFGLKPDTYIKDTKICLEKMKKICEERYPYDLFINENEEEVLDNLKKYLITKHFDNRFFYDNKINPDDYDDSYKILKEKNDEYKKGISPTFPILWPVSENIGFEKLTGENSEQGMMINFFRYMMKEMPEDGNVSINFLKVLFSKIIHCLDVSLDKKLNEDIFNRGTGDIEKKYRNDYHAKYDIQENKDKKFKVYQKNIISFREYLKEVGAINDDPKESVYAKRSKTFRFPYNYMEKAYKEYWLSSHNRYFKNKNLEDITAPDRTRKSTPLYLHKKIDDFIYLLKQDRSESKNYDDTLNNLQNYLINKDISIKDSPFAERLRNLYINEYKDHTDQFLKKNMAEFLWFNHLCYTQMMHLLSFNDTPDDVTFFNCGIPNFLTILTGGYKSLNEKNTKAFFSMVITKNPDSYNEIYGNIEKIRLKSGLFLVITNWRRISMDRCTFIRDSFYSVFSSSISQKFDLLNCEDENYWLDLCAIKSIISCCTNQQIQEFLMDNRYALMSSFSSYTNISKLLLEKFAPPYKNVLSVWIVNRLFTRLKIITNKIKEKGNVMAKIPDFDLITNQRKKDSVGGKINIPSLWTDHICYDIEQLLEEAFIYVHTMKEPANTYHEKIKAIKTINKYQDLFNKTDEKIKHGNIWTVQDFTRYAEHCESNEIGFSSSIIYHSFNNLMNILKPDFKKIIHSVLSESIGEIASTKSVIHSLNREIQEITDEKEKMTKMKKIKKRLKIIYNDEYDDSKIKENMKIYVRDNKSSLYKSKERQKVWETLIEIMEKRKEIETVEDLCQYFVECQDAMVECDICIKAQYGSKREFYVINIGAKAMARIVEKFFQKISELCQSECISIPGDKKMMTMQKTLDNATIYAKSTAQNIRYVNGDCTKWSAAETMGSFLSMVEALKNRIPIGFYYLLKTCFSTWADKKINIPYDIYSTVIPHGKETYYLMDLDDGKKFIRSTQNFLQGMFNYASSIKASSCHYYTSKLWKLIRPESKLESFHLEHSDDYVQVICYKNDSEFEEFRSLYKYVMRLHGYNDSVRKTSCQQIFMEFVSLMSFNGKMMYPKIKKSKEINLNLPCTSYKDDIESALSRQGECVRMGCNQSFCYFFSKLHIYCVQEAYSLLPGMRNEIKDSYDTPIELFGTPDQLPIFPLYCQGNINNYRLIKHSIIGKRIIKGLFKYSMAEKNLDDFLFEDYDGYNGYLMAPFFRYDKLNKALTDIRRSFNVDLQSCRDFWQNNISYKFIKPVNRDKLIDWLKLMYFNQGFTEAYIKLNRSKMTMRISSFVGKKIISLKSLDDFYIDQMFKEKKMDHGLSVRYKADISEDLYDIKDYYNKMMNYIEMAYLNDISDEKVTKVVLRSDPTATAIYSIISGISINYLSKIGKTKNNQIATLTPYKIGWFYINNSPQILLQYLYNEENFWLDKRSIKSQISFDKDIIEIKKIFEIKTKDVMEVQTIYNDLVTAKYKPILYMGYERGTHTLLDSIISQIKFNTSYRGFLDCNSKGVNVVTNPFNNLPYYLGTKKPTENTAQQCLETLCEIFVYLKKVKNMEIYEIKKWLNNVNFKYYNQDMKEIITNFNYVDVLNLFNPNTIDISKHPLYLQKISSYLRWVLLADDDLLDFIVSNVYTYTYDYIKSGTYIVNENRYIGESVCIFNYLNNDFIYEQKDNEVPIMYTNTKSITLNKIAYMIALKLSNNLKEYELFEKMIKPDLYKYSKNYNSYKIVSKLFYDNKKDEYRWIYNRNNEFFQDTTPIFYTKEKIQRRNIKKGKFNFKPVKNVNHEKLSIYIGKNKLFTLPFWNCNQYDVVDIKDNIRLDNISMNDWINKALFHKVLHHKRIYKEDITDYHPTYQTRKELLDTLKGITKYRDVINNIDNSYNGLNELFVKEDEGKIDETKENEPLIIPDIKSFNFREGMDKNIFDKLNDLEGIGQIEFNEYGDDDLFFDELDDENDDNTFEYEDKVITSDNLINRKDEYMDISKEIKMCDVEFINIDTSYKVIKTRNYLLNSLGSVNIHYIYYKNKYITEESTLFKPTALFNTIYNIYYSYNNVKDKEIRNILIMILIYIFKECHELTRYNTKQKIIYDFKTNNFIKFICMDNNELNKQKYMNKTKFMEHLENVIILGAKSNLNDYKNLSEKDEDILERALNDRNIIGRIYSEIYMKNEENIHLEDLL